METEADSSFITRDKPFGNPDGSRATIENVLSTFVDFKGKDAWSGLAIRKNDLTARVIVGRKGSGKTVYLRRLQAGSSDDNSIYVDSIQQGLPTTSEIVKFCQLFPEDILTEQWMWLWNRAILRSLISHLLHSKELRQHIAKDDLEKLLTKYSNITREVDEIVSIYSQVSEIINSFHNAHQIDNYLRNPKWAELEALVSRILLQCPPICFYLDAVDEEFAHAPMYWLRCQKGLFYQTMRFLRDAYLGGRLHIIICIRDLVLASVYQSEHMTRYYGEPHIRVLEWNRDSISYFFDRKVEMLTRDFFVNNTEEKTVEDWLGYREIENAYYKINEPIKQYILRHTRLLPRDIVLVGNILCEKMLDARAKGSSCLSQETIRNVIAIAAAYFGNEQLHICGSQLASNEMPAHAAQHDYASFYTGNKEYAKTKTDDLKKLIKSIGKDRFDKREFRAVTKKATQIFGENSDAMSVLWQSGMLGYVSDENDEDKYVFYSEDMMVHFKIPPEMSKYVFHPCMIDAIGLKGMDKKPITPWG